MLVGLFGPTDLKNMRRKDICEAWCKNAYWFDDLTVEFCKKLPVTHKGLGYWDLVKAGDREGLIALKQKVELGIREISPSLYTDWMTLQLAKGPFKKGIVLNPRATEAVIGDIRWPEQAKWLRTFGMGRNGRPNRLIFVDADQPLSGELATFPAEQLDLESDGSIDIYEPVADQIHLLKRRFYVE